MGLLRYERSTLPLRHQASFIFLFIYLFYTIALFDFNIYAVVALG
jgi:hypothetical protein